MVHAASDGHEARGLGIADEMHGLARHGQAALDLGADRHPVNIRAKRIGQKVVKLVAAVVAHFVSKQAGTDAEFDLFPIHALERC